MNVLVDTNVFLEFLLKREHYKNAVEFFNLSYLKHNKTYITAISLRDIEYIVHHQVHDSEISKKIQHKAYEMVSKVISTSADVAIESLFEDGDYEDLLQMNAAEEAMVDAIITFNKSDFKNSRIPILTPEEINSIWKKPDF